MFVIQLWVQAKSVTRRNSVTFHWRASFMPFNIALSPARLMYRASTSGRSHHASSTISPFTSSATSVTKDLVSNHIPSPGRSHTSSLLQDTPGAFWQQSRESYASSRHSKPRRPILWLPSLCVASETHSQLWASHKLESDSHVEETDTDVFSFDAFPGQVTRWYMAYNLGMETAHISVPTLFSPFVLFLPFWLLLS